MALTLQPVPSALPEEPHVAPAAVVDEQRLFRISSWFGVAFAGCQIALMAFMTAVVLPHGGLPGDDPVEWGRGVLDSADLYRAANYVFVLVGMLMLGFLGAVGVKLRRADRSGTLATVAISSGTLLALIWPLGAILHDIALDAAGKGTDLRLLAGWDSAAPFTLAFSAIPRLFFIGAIVLGLRAEGRSPRLSRIGVALLPISLIGTAMLVSEALFPFLALSTLAFELWVGAVAIHWLRRR